MSVKLKSCPFCGSKAILRKSGEECDTKIYTVECSNDDCACGIGYFKTEEEAKSYWNKRV